MHETLCLFYDFNLFSLAEKFNRKAFIFEGNVLTDYVQFIHFIDISKILF